MSQPGARLDYKYSPPPVDVLTIEGVKYSGDFFRVMAMIGPSKQAFRMVGRTADGVLTIERVEEKQ